MLQASYTQAPKKEMRERWDNLDKIMHNTILGGSAAHRNPWKDKVMGGDKVPTLLDPLVEWFEVKDMKLWMIGWPGNRHAEAGYGCFSYTLSETEEGVAEKFKRAKNLESHTIELFPEQDDLDRWIQYFKEQGEWIE